MAQWRARLEGEAGEPAAQYSCKPKDGLAECAVNPSGVSLLTPRSLIPMELT